MKRVLIIKTSSLGDVIHTLPALTDALAFNSEYHFDWVVEPNFAEIPHWHAGVKQVIAAPLRQWRKMPWQLLTQREFSSFVKKIRQVKYDAVIDAQCILKSAVVSRLTRGIRYGYNRKSSRGGLVSLAYDRKIDASKNQHAVEKTRQLFAKSLGYAVPTTAPDYGINRQCLDSISYGHNTVMLLHGTTWTTKHWPESYWQALSVFITQAGFQVLLPWGNNAECERAHRIKNYCEKQTSRAPIVLPKLSLAQITSLIAQAKGIVAVDTGLGHVAAAMATPTVSLYGPTDPKLTGAYGPNQHHLRVHYPCAPCLSRECKLGNDFAVQPPCFSTLAPEKVWQTLYQAMQPAQLVRHG